MKCYDYDLYDLIFYFTDKFNSTIDNIEHRFIMRKKGFYDEYFNNRGKQLTDINYIHESVIELVIFRAMKTLYSLIMIIEDPSSTLNFKTISHGDIKPKNIIIRSSRTRPTDIVLTDYGTCGPDQNRHS